MDEKVTTSIVLPKELWEKMREFAFLERISLGELVRVAVAEYLVKKGSKKKGGKK